MEDLRHLEPAAVRHVDLRGQPAGGQFEHALTLWRGFPVDATPRPIVPLGEGIVLDPRSGFRTGAEKIAYEEGRFALRTALPGFLVTFGRFHVAPAVVA